MARHIIDSMSGYPSPYRQVVAARATTDAAVNGWAVEVELAKYWPYAITDEKVLGKGRAPGHRARFTTHCYTDWRRRFVADDSLPPQWGGTVRFLYQGKHASLKLVQPVDTLAEAIKRLKAKLRNTYAETGDLAAWLDAISRELEAA